MQDFLGRVIVIFTSCLLIFIVPLLLITLKQDDTTQSYVTDAVTEFVDKSRATGHISVNNYEELIQRLDATGILYEIKINHYSSKHGTGENQELFIKSEILDVLYGSSSTSSYEMQLGDYLQVEVYNKTATLGHKVFSFFSGELRTGNISCVYGGYVGSNMQK